MKSNYQKILHFYNEFGINIPAESNINIFLTDPASVYYALDNLKDYIHDYTEALEILKQYPHGDEDDAGSDECGKDKKLLIPLTNIKYACIGMCIIMGINEDVYNTLTTDTLLIPTDIVVIHKSYSYIKTACIKKNYYEVITKLYELEYFVSGIIINMGYDPTELLNILYEKNMIILQRKIAKRNKANKKKLSK